MIIILENIKEGYNNWLIVRRLLRKDNCQILGHFNFLTTLNPYPQIDQSVGLVPGLVNCP